MDLTTSTARFERIYRSLVLADMKRQLAPFFPPETLPENDLAYALSVASRFALGADGSNELTAPAAKRAYDVAIRSLSFGNGTAPVFREASGVVLSRLGNFPAIRLLRERYEDRSSPFSALENLAREFENRVTSQGSSTILTDFQVRLLRALEGKKWVSVSAPTSAGKSFTLELEIKRQLEREGKYQVAYLVPTRALIRQVTLDLVQIVRGTPYRDVPILSVPSPPEELVANAKIIYVLTQERFANLLAAAGTQLKLDALIVDEAQGISEQDRGQTLEAVIGEALRRFPSAKVFFSSPLKSNPEYLPIIFAAGVNTESFVEYMAPVAQNILSIRPLKGRGCTQKAQFDIWLEGEFASLGTVDLPFKFRKPYLHMFAINLTAPDQTSIIYCNEPSGAEKIAGALAEHLPDNRTDDPAIEEVVDFLREHIHSKYRLADVLEKRVAFHYGNIPQIIRARIEELSRDRIVRFVCCTSTLLQGMNLPAKNIFVENPKKGWGRPMSPSDFWNLVGRAGRMAKEFEGNIYCIHGVEWESDPLKAPKLDRITSAFTSALTDHVDEVVQVASEPPASSESEISWAEQTVARVYSQYTTKNARISESQFSNDENRSALQDFDQTMTGLAMRQTLPPLIFEQNLFFHPSRLELLANRFRVDGPVLWVPPNPRAANAYAKLSSCFQLLDEVFFRTGHQTYKYDAFLALAWMKGASLKQLIENKIEYKKAGNDIETINHLIRELFDEVETKLRYKYVKYMRTYRDVLISIFEERGRGGEAERIPPIHLYLEYGASSVTLINLIAIGLSRTSAILLKHARGLGDELSTRDCQEAIERIDVKNSSMPAICKQEITRLRRRN